MLACMVAVMLMPLQKRFACLTLSRLLPKSPCRIQQRCRCASKQALTGSRSNCPWSGAERNAVWMGPPSQPMKFKKVHIRSRPHLGLLSRELHGQQACSLRAGAARERDVHRAAAVRADCAGDHVADRAAAAECDVAQAFAPVRSHLQTRHSVRSPVPVVAQCIVRSHRLCGGCRALRFPSCTRSRLCAMQLAGCCRAELCGVASESSACGAPLMWLSQDGAVT